MAAGGNHDEHCLSTRSWIRMSPYVCENSKWLDHAATELLPRKSPDASSKERLMSLMPRTVSLKVMPLKVMLSAILISLIAIIGVGAIEAQSGSSSATSSSEQMAA